MSTALGPDEDFERFTLLLSEHLGWPLASTRSSRLREDLEADSLDMFEIVVALSALSGHDVPTEALREVVTLGDLYELAQVYEGHRTG